MNFLIDLQLTHILSSFVTIFIIFDPFLAVTAFVSLTRGMKEKEKNGQVNLAVFVAFSLIMVFLFLGNFILELMGITLPSFVVAGGLILLLLGIQEVLRFRVMDHLKSKKKNLAAAVIVGTPLLCGPGTITTVIILSRQYGLLPPLIAGIAACAITWIMLRFSDRVTKFLGERFMEVSSRILGLLLTAIAAEMIKNGIISMINDTKIL